MTPNDPRERQRRARRRLSRIPTIAATTVALVVTVLFGIPLVWMLISSFRHQDDIFRYLFPLSIESIVPKEVTLENYKRLFETGYLTTVGNTAVATTITVIVGLLVSTPAAFVLAVMRFRGRSIVFALLVIGFIIPFDVLAFPLAYSAAKVGLANSMVAIVLPMIGSGLAVFLLRQFFLSVPRSLYEAARVDGASALRVLWSVYLPISRPAVIGAAILFFVAQWQAYLWPLMVAPAQESQLASVRIGTMMASVAFQGQYAQVLAASTILFLLPAAFILLFQRYFIKSIATSGLSDE